MKKKFLLILLVLAVVLTPTLISLAATKNITFLTPETDPTSVKIDQAIIKAFEKANPGVKVELQHSSINDLLPKLSVMIKARTAPDVVFCSPRYVAGLVGQDMLLPLNDVWENIGDINPRFITLRDDKGYMYDIPLLSESMVLYYRTDLFEKYDVKVPTTYDEYVEAARKLTRDTDGDGKIDLYGVGINGVAPDVYVTFVSFMWSNGAKMFDENNNVIIDSPEAIEALEYMGKMLEFTPPGVANTTYHDQAVQFAQGLTAMVRYPGRLLQNVERYNPELGNKIGAARTPVGPSGKESVVRTGINDFIVFKSTREPEIAKKFIEFYMADKQYLEFLTEAVPGHSLPVRKSFIDNPDYYVANDFMRKYQTQIKQALNLAQQYGCDFHLENPGVANPYIGEAVTNPVFAGQLAEFVAGNVSAEQALRTIADTWRKTLDLK